MADLVTVAKCQDFIGISQSTDTTLVTDILEHVEALFERETGRSRSPYSAALTARAEVKDGTGTDTLFLDYPISAITTVKLGHDSSDPVETLDATDPDTLTFATGSRRLVRTDGGVFGRPGQARYVHVTYNTQADLPDDAQLAIKRVVAMVYRQRGHEDATSESLANHSIDFARSDPFWERAVKGNRRLAAGIA